MTPPQEVSAQWEVDFVTSVSVGLNGGVWPGNPALGGHFEYGFDDFVVGVSTTMAVDQLSTASDAVDFTQFVVGEVGIAAGEGRRLSLLIGHQAADSDPDDRPSIFSAPNVLGAGLRFGHEGGHYVEPRLLRVSGNDNAWALEFRISP